MQGAMEDDATLKTYIAFQVRDESMRLHQQ
jgi:hypothetical protein